MPSYRIFLRIKEIAKLFSPKYRGNVLLGDVAEVAGEIIRETCKKLDSEADKREE
jgi:predicted transcriptional regulator